MPTALVLTPPALRQPNVNRRHHDGNLTLVKQQLLPTIACHSDGVHKNKHNNQAAKHHDYTTKAPEPRTTTTRKNDATQNEGKRTRKAITGVVRRCEAL
jgi:hypothetical protein